MSRNAVIAIVAAIVVIVILFLIPWGGDEAVETGAVEPAEEIEDASGTVAADAGDAEVEVNETTEPGEAFEEAAGTGETEAEEIAEDVTADETEETGSAPLEEADVQTEVEAETGTGMEAASEAAQDIATEGVDSESAALMLDEEGMLTVLSVEGFDYDQAVAIIETADIPDEQKATLLAGMDAARDEPEELAEVLERARESIALGPDAAED